MIEIFIKEVRRIAPQLKAGLDDPLAAQKLEEEKKELNEKLDAKDWIGALTELADVCYYSGKAILNNLINTEEAERAIDDACAACNVDQRTALLALRAKYSIRCEGRKDDQAERDLVQFAAEDLAHLPDYYAGYPTETPFARAAVRAWNSSIALRTEMIRADQDPAWRPATDAQIQRYLTSEVRHAD